MDFGNSFYMTGSNLKFASRELNSGQRTANGLPVKVAVVHEVLRGVMFLLIGN